MSLSDSAPLFHIARLQQVEGADQELQQFDAWTDRPLLQSLEEGGLHWPSSCRNGTCRTCLGQLKEGTVRYLIEWPGVSTDERNSGLVLPCVCAPTSDVVLSPVDGQ